MNRTDFIRNTIAEHLIDIGAFPLEVAGVDWPGEHSTNLRAPLGFTSPEPNEDGDWVATFSAERINELTEMLSDDDFDDCLGAMIFCIDHEVILYGKGVTDHAARVESTDNHLAEEAPGSLRLMTQVQMSWLDRQTT